MLDEVTDHWGAAIPGGLVVLLAMASYWNLAFARKITQPVALCWWYLVEAWVTTPWRLVIAAMTIIFTGLIIRLRR